MAARKSTSAEKKPAEDDKIVFKLEIPIEYEGQKVEELDLSGIADLTTQQMAAIEQTMQKYGYDLLMPEVTMQYAIFAAAEVTGKPVALINSLNARDGKRLRRLVRNFFAV